MSESPLAVETSAISKSFGGFRANDNVDLHVAKGTMHAILGENGAGKSTLMNILSGRYRPDRGTISIDGEDVSFHSPLDARRWGIGMVYQHFQLVEKLTVLENIILGQTRFASWNKRWLQRILARRFQSHARQHLQKICREYQMDVDFAAPIWQLAVGERQRVEILKVLYLDAKILIFDEPTSVLTEQEALALFQTLENLRDQGRTILFITHKLREVLRYSQEVTVMRKGRVVANYKTTETDERQLAAAMVGGDFKPLAKIPPHPRGEPALRVESLCCQSDKGIPALHDLSLEVHRGEILGIAGISGNGQEELAECLTGLRPTQSGEIFLHNYRLNGQTPRQISDSGVSYIPADRIHCGVASGLSIEQNLALKNYRQTKHLLLSPQWMRQQAQQHITNYDIRCPSPQIAARSLSGGNLQKLILARECSASPNLVIAVYPTHGLDVAATKFVQRQFIALRQRNTAILYICGDLDELLLISDRIAVLNSGKIIATLPVAECDKVQIGEWMGRTAKY